MPLKTVLNHFIEFRHEVVVKRTEFELKEAEARAHILEGLKIALDNIDDIIKIIRGSKDPAQAKEGLMNSFNLSELQSQAILDMRLQKLTGLEVDKVVAEYKELIQIISNLKSVLENKSKRMEIIKTELLDIKDLYGDERRTEIVPVDTDFSMEDMIAEEEVVLTITHQGYIKRTALNTYRSQRRGGRGVQGAMSKDEDFVEHLLIANTHDTLLCFSSVGKVYWIKVYQIPVASRTSRGKPLVNLLPLESEERITSVLPVSDYTDDHFVFMATSNGIVKKTALINFARQRSVGLRAIGLDEGDELVGTAITDGGQDVMLFSTSGKAIRFSESVSYTHLTLPTICSV